MKNKPKIMSALCIAQPWAQCVIEHGKNVENKSTNLKKRGTIAIYASKSKVPGRFEACLKYYGLDIAWDDVEKGVILGFVDVVDVITNKTVAKNTKKWFIKGSYGYVLKNPIMLKKPVPAKPPNGAISFWHLKGAALKKCLDQVPAARRNKFINWE